MSHAFKLIPTASDLVAGMCVVLYIRFSSHGQNEQTVEGQIRICKEYAERLGYTVVGIYIDKAKTGTNDNRPEFQKMIAAASSGAFQYILVYKFDRFARNRVDSMMYKARLKKDYGIRVISATEPVSDDEGGEIYEMFLEWNDEKYSQRLSKRIRDGLVTALENGQYTGGAGILYGYTFENTEKVGKKGVIRRVIIDEEKAEIVRYVFEEYAKGIEKHAICKVLNDKGLRYKGKLFTWKTFDHWLYNTKYIGEFERFGRVWTNVYPAIIDRATFDKVQERRKENEIMGGAKTAVEPYILTSKAFCTSCGTAIVSDGGTSNTGAKHYYYACKKKKKALCQEKRCHKNNIEKAVTEFVVDCLSDPEIRKQAVEDAMKFHDQRTGDDGLKSVETRIAHARAEVEQLTQSFIYARNDMLRASIEQKMDEMEIYLKDLNKQVAQIKLERSFKVTKEQIVEFVTELIKGDTNDKSFQKRIIDRLIYKVYIGGGVFFALVNFFDLNKTEHISFDEAQEILEGSSVQTPTPLLHQTRQVPNR